MFDLILESFKPSLLAPLGRKKLDNNERDIKAMAITQVAFSTTSVLRLTPIIWLGATKFAAIPPFGFWMSTNKVSNKQATTIKIKITLSQVIQII